MLLRSRKVDFGLEARGGGISSVSAHSTRCVIFFYFFFGFSNCNTCCGIEALECRVLQRV